MLDPHDVIRCEDCLDDFGDDQRFVVYKGEPFIDTDAGDVIVPPREFVVCEDCAGWYRESVAI